MCVPVHPCGLTRLIAGETWTPERWACNRFAWATFERDGGISGLWKRSKTCRVNGGRPIALNFRVLWVAGAGVSHAASHGASHAALYISQHTQTNTHLHTHYRKLPLFVASMHHMWRQDFCFHHCRAYSLEAGRENIEFSNYEPNDFPSTETRIFLQPNSLPWNASYFSREHSNCINLLFSQQIALFSVPPSFQKIALFSDRKVHRTFDDYNLLFSCLLFISGKRVCQSKYWHYIGVKLEIPVQHFVKEITFSRKSKRHTMQDMSRYFRFKL